VLLASHDLDRAEAVATRSVHVVGGRTDDVAADAAGEVTTAEPARAP